MEKEQLFMEQQINDIVNIIVYSVLFDLVNKKKSNQKLIKESFFKKLGKNLTFLTIGQLMPE